MQIQFQDVPIKVHLNLKTLIDGSKAFFLTYLIKKALNISITQN